MRDSTSHTSGHDLVILSTTTLLFIIAAPQREGRQMFREHRPSEVDVERL